MSPFDSHVFSLDAFRHHGVFVLRNAIPPWMVAIWREHWDAYYGNGDREVPFNPVSVDGPFPDALKDIARSPSILNVIERVFGPDIALYNFRFVVKDRHARGPVFLHHDTPYHLGFPDKLSAFVPLSQVMPENGGMAFWPGTHRLGYLGDAGELDGSEAGLARCALTHPATAPELLPGDLVLMHSALWHQSLQHVEGPDRVMADIIYQPASDPSGIELLRGMWKTPCFIDRAAPRFVRSRTSRIRELEERRLADMPLGVRSPSSPL